MSVIKSILRGSASTLDTLSLIEGARAYDKTNKTLRVFDGTTVGGIKLLNEEATINLTDTIEYRMGASVASASTTNIWGAGGNILHITGTTNINSFGTAPQAGSSRTLIFDGILTLVNSANLIIPSGVNYITKAGDILVVIAETTTQHRLVVSGMQASNALSEIAALGLQTTALTNIRAAAATDVATLITTVTTNLDIARHGDFVSSNTSYTNGGLVTIAHGLGAQPSHVNVTAVCAITEQSIPVGAEVNVVTGNAAANYGFAWYSDTTNIYIRVANAGIFIPTTSGAWTAATVANWRLKARAWK